MWGKEVVAVGLKKQMIDKDVFLNAEEKQLLDESYEHEKRKELTPSADLKKELNPIHSVPLLKTK